MTPLALLEDRAYVLAWLAAFVVTELLEAPIYRRLLGVSLGRALAASALTHPVLWFVFTPVFPGNYVECVIVGELCVWLAEAAYFAPVAGIRRALRASLVANGTSFAIGLAWSFAH